VFGTYVDETLALITGSGGPSNTNYYHDNRVYSVAALTNSSGTVIERYRYDAYGQQVVLAADTVGRTYALRCQFGISKEMPLAVCDYGSYVDEPLAIVAGSGGPTNTKYLHDNRVYSVAAMTDNTGAVVERYRYVNAR
jgi:hypothetical protein